MSNIYRFMNVYKQMASGYADDNDVLSVYWDLYGRLSNTENIPIKLSKSEDITSISAALFLDKVVEEFINRPSSIQEIYPTVTNADDFALALTPSFQSRQLMIKDISFSEMVLLEKQQTQVGLTNREEIKSAIDEYERLYKADLASPAEILTLARYYGPESKYASVVQIKQLESEENEPLVVGGPASVETVDSEGHLITTEALKKAFDAFMGNFRGRNMQIFHCVAAETKVWERGRGYTPICEIKVGDSVVTHTGETKRVLNTVKHRLYDKVFEISLANGENIRVTAEHKLLTKDGWKEAKDLTIDDVLMTVRLKDNIEDKRVYERHVTLVHNGTKICSVKEIEFNEDVYNLEVADNHSYAGRGIIYHNSDVKVGWPLPAYITKTGKVFKSGVDDTCLWIVSELRNDMPIAKKVAEEIRSGEIKSYSIAGSATDTEIIQKGNQPVLVVKDLVLAEVTYCLIPGTKIWTRNGLKSIENVQINDQVYTHRNQWRRVTDVITHDINEEICIIYTNRGGPDETQKIGITKNHGIYTTRDPNKQFTVTLAGELKVGDMVLCDYCYFAGSKRAWIHAIVSNVENVMYKGAVYNLTVAEDHSYATEVMVVANCKQGVNPGAHFEILKACQENCVDLDSQSIRKSLLSNSSFSSWEHLIDIDDGRVIIKADRPNSITDEIEFELSMSLPSSVKFEVAETRCGNGSEKCKCGGKVDCLCGKSKKNRTIEIRKQEAQTVPLPIRPSGDVSDVLDVLERANYRPAEKEMVECHTCTFYSLNYCLKLHSIVEPEYVCDFWKANPNPKESERWAEVSHQSFEEQEKNNMSKVTMLKEWMQKYHKEIVDHNKEINDMEPERRKKLKELQKYLGFPVDDFKKPVPFVGFPDSKVEQTLPWQVNQMGSKVRESEHHNPY